MKLKAPMKLDGALLSGSQSLDRSETISQRLRQYGRAITVAELCEVLHVSKQLVYKMADQNVMPSLKFGGVVRFDPSRVATWLDEREGRPTVNHRAQARYSHGFAKQNALMGY